MQKEIHEQPRAIGDTLEAIIDAAAFEPELFGKDARELLAGVEGVQILACGTSFYAGSVARDWTEAISGLPCSVEIARESRYRQAVASARHLRAAAAQAGDS